MQWGRAVRTRANPPPPAISPFPSGVMSRREWGGRGGVSALCTALAPSGERQPRLLGILLRGRRRLRVEMRIAFSFLKGLGRGLVEGGVLVSVCRIRFLFFSFLLLAGGIDLSVYLWPTYLCVRIVFLLFCVREVGRWAC